MPDVTVVGLGRMGNALVRALLVAGHRVTVWNRSPERASAIVELGAVLAPALAQAAAASDTLFVCIDTYSSAGALFSQPELAPVLTGRTLVQFTTGTPKDARDASQWFESRHVSYLDAAILSGPAGIGKASTLLLYSGNREAFDRCHPLLESLSVAPRFLGADAGAAAVIDLAWLSKIMG